MQPRVAISYRCCCNLICCTCYLHLEFIASLCKYLVLQTAGWKTNIITVTGADNSLVGKYLIRERNGCLFLTISTERNANPDFSYITSYITVSAILHIFHYKHLTKAYIFLSPSRYTCMPQSAVTTNNNTLIMNDSLLQFTYIFSIKQR